MPIPSNIFADIPGDLPEELVQAFLNSPNVRIERIVSLGHASPEGFWYDQEENEWVLVVQGAAKLRFEGQDSIKLAPGSFVNIPAHQRHRVEWTDPKQPTIWVVVHYK